jgi:Mrp family chromosome partitioning ATPase
MTESGPITDYGRQFVDGKLWIMTSGVCHTGGQLLASEAMRARLKDLRDTFDFVLIDAPPITPFVDAIQLGCLADGVVLVVGANSTRREAAVRAKQYLNAANCRVLAAVLNRRTFPIPASIFRWLK